MLRLTDSWGPIDLFNSPELRSLVFEHHRGYLKRIGSRSTRNFTLVSNVIETYKNLPFNPDSLIAPSSELQPLHDPSPPITTLHDVARSVLRNQFVDFGDPDHLALIRLSGWNVYILGTLVKIDPPNNVIFKPGAPVQTLDLARQLKLVNTVFHHFRPNSPPLRTYEEIVALAETPYPTGT